MPNIATSFPDRIDDDSSTLSEQLSDTATQVKDKVGEMTRTAANKLDENRSAAAGGLDKAATALHENAESIPGGEKVAGLAHATADKLSATAGYVREHNVNTMMGDVEALVKKNPGPSLVVAAVMGFLVGRAFSGND